MEDYIKMQQRLLDVFKPLTISTERWNTINAFEGAFSGLTSMQKTLDMYNIQNALTGITQTFQSSLPKLNYNMSGIFAMTKAFQSSLVLTNYDISGMSKALHEMVRVQMPEIPVINDKLISVTRNYADALNSLSNLGIDWSDILNAAYEEIDSDNIIEDDFQSGEEVLEVIQEQTSNPIGFQERVANWSEEKFKKYFIVLSIVLFLWTNFVQPYFQETIGKPVMTYVVSKVKELPDKAGEIIDELKKDVEAVITEDVPYYYKVKYIDEEGVQREGYIAKKNLRFILPTESEDETFTTVD